MQNDKRTILFLTGTRADFGKLKPLIRAIAGHPDFEYSIFVTGMHTLSRYGLTMDEVRKAGFSNIHVFMNQIHGEPMEQILANTISGLSRFVHEFRPDMIVVHGDRVEALAGATVGALQNILVAHIEGGELSGTVDELIRHAVSKLSHLHFVSNQESADRLRQLGEKPENVFVIGSPDIDIMMSDTLPTLSDVKRYYEIPFHPFAVAILHPVTTELNLIKEQARIFTESLLKSEQNYVVIYPNNDEGCEAIFSAYEQLLIHARFRVFPSVRFEYFLTLLKNALYIIGNSSAGVREAPLFGVPCINIGSRQRNRHIHPCIVNVEFEQEAILKAIKTVQNQHPVDTGHKFGEGKSIEKFLSIISDSSVWNIDKQKQFCDL